jgi:nucleotide-binding universal stress UspA family protein
MYAHAAWLHDLTPGSESCAGPLALLCRLGEAQLQVVHASSHEGDHGPLEAVAERMRAEGVIAEAVLTRDPPQAWACSFTWPHGLLAMGRGKTTSSVLREHGCPVLVGAPGHDFQGISSVLVPIDPAVRVGVIAQALELGLATGCQLTFLHVHDVNETCDPDETIASMRDAVRHFVQPHMEGRLKVRFEVGLGEGAGLAINDAARAHDLVLVGARGHKGLKRLVLGSVAELVSRAAPVPVLVVRPR